MFEIHDPARDAWLESRKNYIGASDVGALLLNLDGQPIHPYKTPHELWLEKKGLKTVPMNERMMMGLLLEPIIVDRFKLANPGVKPRKIKTVYGEKPHHGSNPDRHIGKVSQVPGMNIVEPNPKGVKAILQLKSAGYFAAQEFGIDGTDQVPDWYLAQVQWEMYTAKADLCVLALLYDTSNYHQFLIYRDEELIATLKAYVDRFWEKHILTGEPPRITGHKKDTEYLQGAWEPKNDGVVVADQTTCEVAENLSDNLVKLERLASLVEQQKNDIKVAIGENACLMTSVGQVTWRANKNGVRSLRLDGIKAKETANV